MPAALLTAVLLALEGAAPEPSPEPLTVCADPNHLPFSNERGEGFENRLAELVARELGRPLRYVFRPQRRGFLREGLGAGACDLVMGLPTGLELAATTRPYYRSGYAFVQRKARAPVSSLGDPRLERLRIGVQLVGDDYSNSPPAHALAQRGLAKNLRGYLVYGDYRTDSPVLDVVRAVERGEVDLAVAWGPVAGWGAKRGPGGLLVSLVPETEGGALPMRFDISMAVRRGNRALLEQLDAVIERRRADIDALLAEYGVPRG